MNWSKFHHLRALCKQFSAELINLTCLWSRNILLSQTMMRNVLVNYSNTNNNNKRYCSNSWGSHIHPTEDSHWSYWCKQVMMIVILHEQWYDDKQLLPHSIQFMYFTGIWNTSFNHIMQQLAELQSFKYMIATLTSLFWLKWPLLNYLQHWRSQFKIYIH